MTSDPLLVLLMRPMTLPLRQTITTKAGYNHASKAKHHTAKTSHSSMLVFFICVMYMPCWCNSWASALDQMVMGSVPGWVTTHVPLLPSSINWYRQKLGSKQATT